MGLSALTLTLYEKSVLYLRPKNSPYFMCELGNQRIPKDAPKELLKWRTAKAYFKSLGYVHISIDINGRDGAIPLDLGRPITQFLGAFDIITNFGTTEHVINQYNCWQNIHNFAAEGCLFIHAIPMIGFNPSHAPYLYPENFLDLLSKLRNYNLLYSQIEGSQSKVPYLGRAILQKTDSASFISKEQFNTIPIRFDKNNKRFRNYAKQDNIPIKWPSQINSRHQKFWWCCFILCL